MENKLKIDNNTVVHCPTEELANKVLAIADKLGYKWFDGGSFLDNNSWYLLKEETCYNFKKGMLVAVYSYKKNNYNLISAEDFLKLHKEKEKPILYYIRGVEDRGEEVIKMLEEKGGINKNELACENTHYLYFIKKNGVIDSTIFHNYMADILTTYGTELFLPEKKEYEFKPFEKVLVRNSVDYKWRCNFFSHPNDEGKAFPYVCGDYSWKFCIPYEGNEHLLRTTNNK